MIVINSNFSKIHWNSCESNRWSIIIDNWMETLNKGLVSISIKLTMHIVWFCNRIDTYKLDMYFLKFASFWPIRVRNGRNIVVICRLFCFMFLNFFLQLKKAFQVPKTSPLWTSLNLESSLISLSVSLLNYLQKKRSHEDTSLIKSISKPHGNCNSRVASCSFSKRATKVVVSQRFADRRWAEVHWTRVSHVLFGCISSAGTGFLNETRDSQGEPQGRSLSRFHVPCSVYTRFEHERYLVHFHFDAARPRSRLTFALLETSWRRRENFEKKLARQRVTEITLVSSVTLESRLEVFFESSGIFPWWNVWMFRFLDLKRQKYVKYPKRGN